MVSLFMPQPFELVTIAVTLQVKATSDEMLPIIIAVNPDDREHNLNIFSHILSHQEPGAQFKYSSNTKIKIPPSVEEAHSYSYTGLITGQVAVRLYYDHVIKMLCL